MCCLYVFACVPVFCAAADGVCGTQVSDGAVSFDVERGLTRIDVSADDWIDMRAANAADISLDSERAVSAEQTGPKAFAVYFDTVIQRNRDYTLNFGTGIKTFSGKALAAAEIAGNTAVLEDKNDSFEFVHEKSGGVYLKTIDGSSADGYKERNVFGAEAKTADGERDYVVYSLDGDAAEIGFWTYSWGYAVLADGGNTVEDSFSVWVSADGMEYTRLSDEMFGRDGWHLPGERFPDGEYGFVTVTKYASYAELPAGVRYIKIVFPRLRRGTAADGGTAEGTVLLGDVNIRHFRSANAVRLDTLGDIAPSDTLSLRLGETADSLDGTEFKINGKAVRHAVLENGGKKVRLALAKPLEANTDYALTIRGNLNIAPECGYIGFHTMYSRDSEDYIWKSVNIGGGGMVTGLVFHPTEQNLLYARTDVGGAYRRDYENDCWIPLTDKFPIEEWNSLSVNGLCVDPGNPDVVYIACGGVWYAKGGVYKSEDRGETWQKLPLTPVLLGNDGRLDGECIAVDPSDSDTVYCGTAYEGLFVSHDGGANWARVEDIPVTDSIPQSREEYEAGEAEGRGIGVRSVYFMPLTDSGYMICASVFGKGIYASTDNGESWTHISGSPTKARRMTEYMGKLYVSCRIDAENGFYDGLYCYDGTRWTSAAPEPGIEMNGITAGTVGGKKLLYCASNTDRKLFFREDGGEWQAVFNPSNADNNDVAEHMPWITTHAKVWGGVIGGFVGGLALNPNGGGKAELWLGDGWSVWCNPDALTGNVFYAECKNVNETVVNTVCAPSSGNTLLMTGFYDYGGVRHTVDNADGADANAKALNPIYATEPIRPFEDGYYVWGTSVTSADYCAKDGSFLAFFTDTYRDGVECDGGGSLGVVALSEDGGETWNKYGWDQDKNFYAGCVAVGAEPNADGKPTVLAVQKSDGTSTAYVKRSADFGRTWTNAEGLPANLLSGSHRKQRNIIAADRMNGNKFYVTDRETGDFYYSHNGGASFEKAEGRVPVLGIDWENDSPSNEYLNDDIEANPNTEGDVVTFSYGGGLYRSTDSGMTLTHVDGPSRVSAFSWGAETEAGISSAFVLGIIDGRRGIYRSDDNLKTWIYTANPDMGLGCTVACIEGDKRVFGRVYAATLGRGVFYADTAAVKRVTFTDDKADGDWLILDGASKRSNEDTWQGWYATCDGFDSGEIIFTFDGSRTKLQGNHRYRLNGPVERLSFIAAGHADMNASDIEIQLSSDGENWRSIGTGDMFGQGILYELLPEPVAAMPTWMVYSRVTLGRAQLGSNTKYVRLLLGRTVGILLPEVTYLSRTEDYEINDAAYTLNGDGTATASGRVYFNRDGDKESAAFTVFTAAYRNGILTGAAAERFENVKKGGFAEFLQIIGADSGMRIKTFVFESEENLLPVAAAEERTLK